MFHSAHADVPPMELPLHEVVIHEVLPGHAAESAESAESGELDVPALRKPRERP
jgi:hypothetical protein